MTELERHDSELLIREESEDHKKNLHSLMNPKSIAVIGASQRRSRGTQVLSNLKSTNFEGGIYGINPKYDETEGFPCFSSVGAIHEPVDCVVAAIPADGVPGALEDAFEAGTRAAVVLSSGFGEGGHAPTERVARLRNLASRGMAICGPNCYGILNRNSGAAAFSGQIAQPLIGGPVSLVSQSGGFANTISTPLIEDRGVGFGFLVSCGNQIGVSVEEYLEYLLSDPGTQVVAAFVEGFREPHDLGRIALQARELDKPIIILKSGRSEAGKAAAFSHTGSLAGSARVLSALLSRHGYVQVYGIDELVETISLFTVLRNKNAFTREVLVVTGSGGEGSHVADSAEAAGVELAPLAQETRDRIEALLPEFGTAANPIDGTGAMFEDPQLFPALLTTVVEDPQPGLVAVNLSGRGSDGGRHGAAAMDAFSHCVAELAPRTEKVLVTYGTSALGRTNREMLDLLSAAGVPYLAGTQNSMKAIASLSKYRNFRNGLDDRSKQESKDSVQNRNEVNLPNGVVPFLDARAILTSFGVPVVMTEFAASSEQAVEAAERLGYPVVVKIEATGLMHKSESGGVVLNCASESDVRSAFETVVSSAAKAGVSSIEGVLVQPMIESGIEAIAGVTVDPQLGPALVFGLGGVFVEIINDTTLDILPLTFHQAREMVNGIRGREILLGARGRKPADIDAVARTLVAIGDFAIAYQDQLVSLDVNPLLIRSNGSGCIALDLVLETRNE